MTSQLYREHILDLWKNPLNFGDLPSATHKHKELNSLCGDEIEMQLKVENSIIKEIKFKGRGCAISIASASILTESLKNQKLEKAEELSNKELLEKLKIPLSPARIKCALISLDALKGAVK